MKRTAQMAKIGNNIPRPRGQRKKALNPQRPQDQGTEANREKSRRNNRG